MIYVTRLNHTSIVLNSHLIDHIESTPDTVISMTTGEKLRVLESAEGVICRGVEYERRVRQPDDPEVPRPTPDGEGASQGKKNHDRRSRKTPGNCKPAGAAGR